MFKQHCLPFGTRPVAAAVVVALGAALSVPTTALATWSIVLIDTESKEIAIGSATCLTGFDLERYLPVMLVDVGGACAQSMVDGGAVNRNRIRDGLLAQSTMDVILEALEAGDNFHQSRQYGIADTRGRSLTFTGSNAGAWAGGVIGQFGTVVYAIQGNVLTGEPVVAAAEEAVVNTPGDLPAKLMAGMEAARSMGGDGRCSCSSGNPTGCGSPPPDFTKSAHVAFMIVARTGDMDGGCDVSNGCASGDYLLNFNIAFQNGGDPDPVLQMQALFDAWRLTLLNRPDAVASTAVIDPTSFPADGKGTATMTIAIRDWEGTPVLEETAPVVVQHAPDSANASQIGPVVSKGGGVYQVTLTGTTTGGLDRFHVIANDGIRPVTVIAVPTLISIAESDQNADGYVDHHESAALLACLFGPGSAPMPKCAPWDLDGDNDVDLVDAARLLREFTGSPCDVLLIDGTIPDSFFFVLCGESFELTALVTADPPAQFQWFLDATPIPGATQPTYRVESAGDDDVGAYHFEASNVCTTAASQPVSVDVVRCR